MGPEDAEMHERHSHMMVGVSSHGADARVVVEMCASGLCSE